MPLVFVTYSLAYLDRANYGFGAAAGMADDLGLTNKMSALIGSLFALGYCVFQIPGALIAERYSVRYLVFVCLLVWGSFAVLTGVVSGVPGLLAIRFGLGVAEAAVLPAMLIYLNNWFVRSERARANAFLILGGPTTVLWMSIVSGYLVDAAGWRWMFVIEGLPTIVWAFCWLAWMRERPADVDWLSHDEKEKLAAQMAAEQAVVSPVRGYMDAFTSSAVLVLAAQYFFWSMGFFGFVIWLPSILRAASGLGMVATGWLAAAPYLLAVIAMPVVSHISDRSRHRKRCVWISLLVGSVAFAASCLVGVGSISLSVALLSIAGAAMYAPYGAFWAIVPEILPRRVAGGAIALINMVGSLGSFLGAFAVGTLSSVTGSATLGSLFMAGALAVAAALTILVRLPAPSLAPGPMR